MTYKEMLQVYGDRVVQFYEYYKYSFTFVGAGGIDVFLSGLRSMDYRASITADPITVRDLAHAAGITSLYDKNKLIYEDEDEEEEVEDEHI